MTQVVSSTTDQYKEDPLIQSSGISDEQAEVIHRPFSRKTPREQVFKVFKGDKPKMPAIASQVKQISR